MADYNDVMQKIAQNYIGIEQSLVNQLLLQAPHGPTIGTYRENVWKSLFEMIIPKKYCIEQGIFILDSYGGLSNEVDLAVFDEMYTPYIFNYGKIKFIPIEAVAAVIQCKSRITGKEELINWSGSIEKLKTSLDSVARLATSMVDNLNARTESLTQTATRPIRILCGISLPNGMEERFDLVLQVDEAQKRLRKTIGKEQEDLLAWNERLNHYMPEPYPEEKVIYVQGGEEKEGAYRELIKQKSKSSPPSEKAKALNEQAAGNTFSKKTGITSWKFSKDSHYNKPDRSLSSLAVKYQEQLQTDKDGDGGKLRETENVILSLTFQLNQLLMLINNPMMFPHRAYAERFRQVLDFSGTAEYAPSANHTPAADHTPAGEDRKE